MSSCRFCQYIWMVSTPKEFNTFEIRMSFSKPIIGTNLGVGGSDLRHINEFYCGAMEDTIARLKKMELKPEDTKTIVDFGDNLKNDLLSALCGVATTFDAKAFISNFVKTLDERVPKVDNVDVQKEIYRIVGFLFHSKADFESGEKAMEAREFVIKEGRLPARIIAFFWRYHVIAWCNASQGRAPYASWDAIEGMTNPREHAIMFSEKVLVAFDAVGGNEGVRGTLDEGLLVSQKDVVAAHHASTADFAEAVQDMIEFYGGSWFFRNLVATAA